MMTPGVLDGKKMETIAPLRIRGELGNEVILYPY
jgi:hypothetical protein